MCVINKNERNGHLFFAAVQGLILFSFNVIIRPVLLQRGHQGCRYTGLSLGLDQPKESMPHPVLSVRSHCRIPFCPNAVAAEMRRATGA